jgi:hypothetical protein
VKPLHKIAPQSSHVNLPGRDLNLTNICMGCRVELSDSARILGFVLRDFVRHCLLEFASSMEELVVRQLPVI